MAIEVEMRKENKFCGKAVIHDKGIKHVFKNVPYISKYKKCYSCRNTNGECKYYDECVPLRKFDCRKNLNFLQSIYNLLTGIVITYVTLMITFKYNFSIIKGISLFLLFFVAMDISCTVIESFISFTRDKLFYKKLLKRDKKEMARMQKKREEEMQQKKEEEIKKMTETAFGGNVAIAEDFIKSLKKISDENDFGENDLKIEKCVERLEEIIEILKKDSSNYPRVAFLFEVYLPKIYDILMQYVALTDVDCDEEDVKKILTEFIDKFLEFLKSQKIESRLGKDKNQAIIQFRALTKTIESNIEKGE